jgi:hypothetical protein
LRELTNSFLLLVHALHEEKGILDFQRCAGWELLNTKSVHVLCVLQEELVVVGVFLHGVVSLLLLRGLLLLVLHTLDNAILIELQLTVLVGAVVFVVVNITLEYYSTLPVTNSIPT